MYLLIKKKIPFQYSRVKQHIVRIMGNPDLKETRGVDVGAHLLSLPQSPCHPLAVSVSLRSKIVLQQARWVTSGF